MPTQPLKPLSITAQHVVTTYADKVLAGKANALFDEIDLDRQSSTTSMCTTPSPRNLTPTPSKFEGLSHEDKDMAVWLAGQGVDVRHLMRRASFDTEKALNRVITPSASLARAKRDALASRERFAEQQQQRQSPEETQENQRQMVTWLEDAFAEADDSPAAVARRREAARAAAEVDIETAKARRAAEERASRQEIALAKAREEAAERARKEEVARAKAREAAELEAWRRRALEAKAREAAELEEWRLRAVEVKAREAEAAGWRWSAAAKAVAA